MSQYSVVLTSERALRSPNVSQVTFYFDVLILWDVLTATSNDDLELQVANVFNRVILLAHNLAYKRMWTTWENEVMFFAEERFKFIELLWNWFLIARCQLWCFNQHTIKATLCYQDFFWRTFNTELSWNIWNLLEIKVVEKQNCHHLF